jgi:CTP:molybdopterin cytidylyltransferase MocA
VRDDPAAAANSSGGSIPVAAGRRRSGSVCGLILAAGAGTRFGSTPKLLADLHGRPLLEHAIRAQSEVTALARVVVVLGCCAQQLLERVEFMRATPVVCGEWSSGQAASLRCGLDALPEAEKVIVTLGDEPLITSRAIERFVDAPPGARATYGGRPGHPAVLGPEQRRLLHLLGGDRGARSLLDGPEIECAELCSGSDVDLPEDLEAMRDEARAVI